MGKYTPAPWTVTCERNRKNAYNNVGAEGAEWPQSEIALVPCDNPDYAANQALIAAAPDLLAACKAALEFRFTGDRADPAYVADLIDVLRAAIRKAEGGL